MSFLWRAFVTAALSGTIVGCGSGTMSSTMQAGGAAPALSPACAASQHFPIVDCIDGEPQINHARIAGANYFSTGTNPLVFWRDFDSATIANELDLAAGLGVNALRVWLSFDAYQLAPEDYLRNVDAFLSLANERGISILLVMSGFCFGWTGPTATEMWAASPSPFWLDDLNNWQQFKQYVDQIIPIVDSYPPELVMYDAANEPGSNPYHFDVTSVQPFTKAKVLFFVQQLLFYLRDQSPGHEMTVGAPLALDPAEDPVVTFQSHHGGYTGGEGLQHVMSEAASQAIPGVVTEACASTDSIKECVALSKQYGVGFFFWGLMKGFNNWSTWTGLVYSTGEVTDTASAAALSGLPESAFVYKSHQDSPYPKFSLAEQFVVAMNRLNGETVSEQNRLEMRTLPWKLAYWDYIKGQAAQQIKLLNQQAFVLEQQGDQVSADLLIQQMVTVGAQALAEMDGDVGATPLP